MQRFTVFSAVGDDEQLPPASRRFTDEDHQPVCGAVNWVAQIGVHSADAIQVIPRMVPTALGVEIPKFLGVVDEPTVIRAEWRVKPK